MQFTHDQIKIRYSFRSFETILAINILNIAVAMIEVAHA